jgi:PHD/YefM family antitoxin component YafN of YafNO toxin-antitoxin module
MDILSKDGKPEFVVIPYDDFENIKTVLEDYEDLMDLRAGIAADDGDRVSSADIKSVFGLKNK